MKKLFTIVLILSVTFCLSGCHGSKSEETTGFVVPESFDESRNYEITFWAKNDNNINQVNVYKKAIEDFEEIYPNIKVVLKLYTDYTKIYSDVITNISTSTTPNVCITYPDHIATYITGNNTTVDLDALMSDKSYGLGGDKIKFDAPRINEIIPEFLNEGILNGKQYALPFMRSTEALYINEDMVKALGYEVPDILTWDFIWEVSDAATKKDSDGYFLINGDKTMIPFIYKSTDNMMISMLEQSSGAYSDENGKVLLFNDDTKQILMEIGKHTKNGAFSTFKISSYPANFLNAGQCIFAIDSTAGATWMGCDAPLIDIPQEDIVDFNIVVRPIPQYDTNDIKMISQGPSVCLFNKEDPQEVLASWIFTQYLLSNDVQCAYAKTEGYIPVTSKAQNSEQYLTYLNNAGLDNNEHYKVKIDASKLLIDNTSNTFVTNVFNGSASLRTASGQLIEETCKSVRRNKTIDEEYFKQLFSDINSLYRLDQTSSMSIEKDLGPLSKEAKVLLIGLAGIWLMIGCYYVNNKMKSR